MNKYTQEEIIRGCKKKNPLFQKVLVNQYASKLLGVCHRYARDRSSARDILQESLLEIFKSFPNYKEQGNFEAWMKRIVINTALRFLNKKSYRNELYTLDNTAEKSISPDIYSSLAVEDLLELINKLPEKYNTIFNLYAIEGYSHREISEMLDIQESSSRSILTRARAMLKKMLVNNEPSIIFINHKSQLRK